MKTTVFWQSIFRKHGRRKKRKQIDFLFQNDASGRSYIQRIIFIQGFRLRPS